MQNDGYTHERDRKPVTFVDERGQAHDALVTRDWSYAAHGAPGAVNLVYVTGDESMTDQYGLQIVRKTSVPHQDAQSAPGYFWK